MIINDKKIDLNKRKFSVVFVNKMIYIRVILKYLDVASKTINLNNQENMSFGDSVFHNVERFISINQDENFTGILNEEDFSL